MDTTHSETRLDMTRRYYREAVYRLARQIRVLERLKAHGHDTEEAHKVLLNLKDVVKLARQEWEREEQEAGNAQSEPLDKRRRRSLQT